MERSVPVAWYGARIRHGFSGSVTCIRRSAVKAVSSVPLPRCLRRSLGSCRLSRRASCHKGQRVKSPTTTKLVSFLHIPNDNKPFCVIDTDLKPFQFL